MKVSYPITISLKVLMCGGGYNSSGGVIAISCGGAMLVAIKVALMTMIITNNDSDKDSSSGNS